MIDPAALRLYLVVSPADRPSADLVDVVASTIAAGVTCVQLRWKGGTDRELFNLASRFVAVTNSAGIPFIINDRLDLALAVGADGVHLGVDDLPVEAARTLAGDNFIIGYSPETDAQIEAADPYVSYLGIGPVFATATKLDAGSQLGVDEFARRRALTDLPVVAIGGITEQNAAQTIAAGADGIAVVSAIFGAEDPTAATRVLAQVMPPLAT